VPGACHPDETLNTAALRQFCFQLIAGLPDSQRDDICEQIAIISAIALQERVLIA